MKEAIWLSRSEREGQCRLGASLGETDEVLLLKEFKRTYIYRRLI